MVNHALAAPPQIKPPPVFSPLISTLVFRCRHTDVDGLKSAEDLIRSLVNTVSVFISLLWKKQNSLNRLVCGRCSRLLHNFSFEICKGKLIAV